MEILNFEKKQSRRKFLVVVEYLDGTTTQHSCFYFGFDIPGYLSFILRNPGDEEYTWPDFFIREDLIKTINVTQGDSIETN